MTRLISDLDVSLPTLQQQVADLVVRQREQQADRSAERLRKFLAPTTAEETR